MYFKTKAHFWLLKNMYLKAKSHFWLVKLHCRTGSCRVVCRWPFYALWMTFSQYFSFVVFAYLHYYLLFPNRICSVSRFMLYGWHFPNIFHLLSLLTCITIYYSRIESVPLAVLCSVDDIFPIFFICCLCLLLLLFVIPE